MATYYVSDRFSLDMLPEEDARIILLRVSSDYARSAILANLERLVNVIRDEQVVAAVKKLVPELPPAESKSIILDSGDFLLVARRRDDAKIDWLLVEPTFLWRT